MKTVVAELRWFPFREKIMAWQTKRGEDQFAVLDHARERSITILQKRYGYSREEAASELNKHYSKA